MARKAREVGMNSKIPYGTRHCEHFRLAVRRLARRLCVDARDAEAWHALGSVLVEMGDRAGAFAAFSNALKLDDTRRQSQLALGNLLFDSGQLDSALRCFATLEEGRCW
jgi:cytochrome c-type biogenesis protein CcmH/NrfG